MKKIALAIALATTSVTAFANETENTGHYLSVFGEVYQAGSDKHDSAWWNYIDQAAGAGFEYGYRFDKNWAVRVEYARQDFETYKNGGSFEGNRYGIDALFHFNDLPLYAVAGLKHLDTVHDENALNFGLGYKYQINNNLVFNTEANLYQGITDGFTDVGLKMGVSYYFAGKSAPVVTEAPKPAQPVAKVEPVMPPKPVKVDSDNDGVEDRIDNCPNTPSTDAVDSQGCSIFTEKQVKITLSVPFANNSAEVVQSSFKDIGEVAAFMKRFPNTDVVIEGHTSSVGAAAYNQALSEKRANAVAKVLVDEFGIAAERVKAIGYGESRLKDTANTAEAHQVNRRIEAVIEATKKEAMKR